MGETFLPFKTTFLLSGTKLQVGKDIVLLVGRVININREPFLPLFNSQKHQSTKQTSTSVICMTTRRVSNPREWKKKKQKKLVQRGRKKKVWTVDATT